MVERIVTHPTLIVSSFLVMEKGKKKIRVLKTKKKKKNKSLILGLKDAYNALSPYD
jgi:hypothetical protein